MCQSESGFKKMLSNISRYYMMFVVTCDEQDYLYTLLTILHDNTFKKKTYITPLCCMSIIVQMHFVNVPSLQPFLFDSFTFYSF